MEIMMFKRYHCTIFYSISNRLHVAKKSVSIYLIIKEEKEKRKISIKKYKQICKCI